VEALKSAVDRVVRVLEDHPKPLPARADGALFQFAPAEYRDAARELADGLSEADFRQLAAWSSEPPPPSQEFRPDGTPVSRTYAWQTLWHTTVFEILYQARERALPGLRERSTWVKTMPIAARLAGEGVGTQEFVDDALARLETLDTLDALTLVESVHQAADRSESFRVVAARLLGHAAFRRAEEEYDESEG